MPRPYVKNTIEFFKRLPVFLFTLIFIFVNTFFYREPTPLFAASAQIRQEINILDAYLGATANTIATSSAIINIDTTKYSGTVSYYFEIVASTSASFSNTVSLRRSGNGTDDCTVTIPVSTTNYTLMRSSSVCTIPVGSTDYVVLIDSNAGGTTGVKSARVVILQNFPDVTTNATSTQTQIEIGNKETGKTNTATAALSAPKYWKYDSTKWNGTLTAYAEVSYQNTQTSSTTLYSTTGTHTYVGSPGVRYVQVEAWGAGGGGRNTTSTAGGGAGGGGAYARSTTTVAALSSNTIVVPVGGAAGTAGGAADATYNTNVVIADGGVGVSGNSGGAGGNTTNSVGQVEFAGGAGGAALTTDDTGGGGGGGAGPNGAGGGGAAGQSATGGGGGGGNGGNTATTILGGVSTDGGSGGNGGNTVVGGSGTSNVNGGGGGGGSDNAQQGGAGGAPGGGAGGGDATGATAAGARGQIRLMETHGSVGIAIEEDNGSFGGWTFKKQIVTNGVSTSTAARSRSTSFTPTTGRHYRIVASSTTSGAPYSIYNAKIIIDQTSASSFTLLEPQYLLANTSLSSGTGLQSFLTKWDSTEWSGVTNTYIHGVNAADNSTSVVEVDTAGGILVTGSSVASPDNIGFSGSMTMPSNGNLDVKATTNNGDVYASRILAQVSINPPPETVTVASSINQPPYLAISTTDITLGTASIVSDGTSDITAITIKENSGTIDADTELSNMELWVSYDNTWDAADVQLDTEKTFDGVNGEATFTETFSATSGLRYLIVRGDINSSADVGDTVEIQIKTVTTTDIISGTPLEIGGSSTVWGKRKKFTFNNLNQAENLTNFPVMVKLNSGRITYADFGNQSDGTDVRFVDNDNISNLKYEIEHWDTAGDSVFWVKIPQINASSETDYIWMYYGNTGAATGEDAPNVWTNGYAAVYHFAEQSGQYLDSTVYDNDSNVVDLDYAGDSGRANTSATGIGYFPKFNSNGGPSLPSTQGDHVAVADDPTLDFGTSGFTLTARANASETTFDSDFFRKGSTGIAENSWWKIEWGDQATNNRLQYLMRVNGVDYSISHDITPDGNWHTFTGVRDTSDTTIKLYVDGSLINSVGGNNGSVSNSANVGIGSKDTYDDDFMEGNLDEIRFASTTRSAAWIAAEELSLDDEFITYYTAEPITISGTLYSDEGITQILTGGLEINLRVATSSPGLFSTTTIAGSGYWQFNNVTSAAANVPYVVWVNASSTVRAFSITKSSTTNATITGHDLYQNRIIIKHEATSGASITNTNLAGYDRDDDADIQFTSNSGVLTVNKGQELHIWSGKTYAPGGAIRLHGNAAANLDGDLHLDNSAVLTMPTYVAGSSTATDGSIMVAGNWIADPGSTFTPSSNTLNFTATTTGKSLTGTFTGASASSSMVFNGAGGAWSFLNNASTTNLTITAGTVTAPSQLTIMGDFSNPGTFAHNSGILYFSSTTAQTIAGTLTGSSALNNVVFIGSGAKSFSNSASTTNFTIQSGSGAVTAPSGFLNIAGDFSNAGTFTHNSGTTTFSGASAQAISGTLIGASAFDDVAFLGAGTKTFSSNASTTNFFIDSVSSTVVAPSALTISGNYVNSGIFTSNNSGTTTFSGSTVSISGNLTSNSALGNVLFKGGGGGAADWYNASWNYRVPIVVDDTKVDADLTNFSVYLNLANLPSTFFDNTISGCGDIRITTSDGLTEVPREVVWCNTGTDVGEVHFKAPSLANSTDTTFYVYYGNSGASDYAENATYGAQNVWDSNYMAVYHFQETSGNYLDSTANNKDSSAITVTSRTATGKMGYAPDFNGSSDIITFAGSNDITDVTQEAWVVQDTTGTQAIIQHAAGTETEVDNISYGLEILTDNMWQQWEYSGGTNETLTSTAAVGTGSFKSLATTRNSTANTVAWYVNGSSPVGDSSYTNDPTGGSSGSLHVGKRITSGVYFDGIIDEMRLSSNARTATWISTGYNNISAPATFYSVSAQEAQPAGSSVFTFGSSASTTNLFNELNSTLVAPSTLLSISGNYSNLGVFTHSSGTTTFNGATVQNISGVATGTSAFYNVEVTNSSGSDPQSSPSVKFNVVASTTNNFYIVTPNVKVQFPAGATATTSIVNLILNGQAAGTRVSLRSTASSTPFGLRVSGIRSIAYTSVADSNACSGLADIDASGGSNYNYGNNTCWTFGAGSSLSLASASEQVFELSQSPGFASTITVTDGGTPGILAANDLRISIATSTVDMRWLTSITAASFGGTASGKITNSLTYEGGGSVLVIPVGTNFEASDTLTISGLYLTSFGTVVPATAGLQILTGGPSDITVDATDSMTISIRGKYVLQNHATGQVSNKFVGQSSLTASPIYQFKLVPTGENVPTTNIVFNLSEIIGLSTGDFTNVSLVIDYDGDGVVDAGDTAVGGAGSVSIPGQTGTITFSSSFTATTSRDYILVTDIAGVGSNDEFTIGLSSSNITGGSGSVSLKTIIPSGFIVNRNHRNINRAGGGGGGGAGSSEGTPPAGQGTQGGGGAGGGGGDQPPAGDGTQSGGGAGGGGGDL